MNLKLAIFPLCMSLIPLLVTVFYLISPIYEQWVYLIAGISLTWCFLVLWMAQLNDSGKVRF